MFFAYAGYRKSPKVDKWSEEYGVMYVKEGTNPFALEAFKDLQNSHFNYLYDGKTIKREGLLLYLAPCWKGKAEAEFSVNTWYPITKEEYESNKNPIDPTMPILEFTLKDTSKVIEALMQIPTSCSCLGSLGAGLGSLGAGLGRLRIPDMVYTIVFKREKDSQYVEVPSTEIYTKSPRIQKELNRRHQEIYLLPTVTEGNPQTYNQIKTGDKDIKDAIKDPTLLDVYTVIMKGLPKNEKRQEGIC